MPIDKQNYLSVLESFPKQCREALELPKGMTVPGKFSHIIVAGMGGSAIGGDILASYLKNYAIPVTVVKNYDLPKFVDQSCLVFVVSYSGNTEETLSVYQQAMDKKATVIAITSGGKLAELCQKKVLIPAGLQPRAALGYLFFPLLGILHNSGIVSISNSELNEMLAHVKNVEQFKQHAEEITKELRDKIPIIYASDLFYPVAYRFKTQINENSKYPAFCHVFPEMNHNELVSFHNMERKKYEVILIRDQKDHPRIRKRMDVCKTFMEEKVDVFEIHTKGEYLLTRIFSTIYLGDFVSYYLALHNRVDPAPVFVIEKFKAELK